MPPTRREKFLTRIARPLPSSEIRRFYADRSRNYLGVEAKLFGGLERRRALTDVEKAWKSQLVAVRRNKRKPVDVSWSSDLSRRVQPAVPSYVHVVRGGLPGSRR